MSKFRSRYFQAALEVPLGFLAIHGALNLFRATPVTTSLLAYAWVLVSILLAAWLNRVLQRRKTTTIVS